MIYDIDKIDFPPYQLHLESWNPGPLTPPPRELGPGLGVPPTSQARYQERSWKPCPRRQWWGRGGLT